MMQLYYKHDELYKIVMFSLFNVLDYYLLLYLLIIIFTELLLLMSFFMSLIFELFLNSVVMPLATISHCD